MTNPTDTTDICDLFGTRPPRGSISDHVVGRIRSALGAGATPEAAVAPLLAFVAEYPALLTPPILIYIAERLEGRSAELVRSAASPG